MGEGVVSPFPVYRKGPSESKFRKENLDLGWAKKSPVQCKYLQYNISISSTI